MNLILGIILSIILIFFPTHIPSRAKFYSFIVYSIIFSLCVSVIDLNLIPFDRNIFHSLFLLFLGSIQVFRFRSHSKLYARLAYYRIHFGPLYYYLATVQALESRIDSYPIRNISLLIFTFVFVAVYFRPKPNTSTRRRVHGTCMSLSYFLVCVQLWMLIKMRAEYTPQAIETCNADFKSGFLNVNSSI